MPTRTSSETRSRLARRRFLACLGGGIGAAAAGTLLPASRLFAQAPHRIDVHQHFVSPSFLDTLNEKNRVAPVAGLFAWKGYSPAAAVEALEGMGVATAMLSITAPGVWFGDVDEARRLARELNEFATQRLVGDHPGRFGLFAVLPLPDIDGSLAEIEYAFDSLHADGVGVLTSYGNTWLGDPSFESIFEELNRRSAVVYTHPVEGTCCQNLLPGVAPQMLEYPTDTSRTIVSLVVNGVAARFPNIRFIFSHAGGTLTGFAGRLLGPEGRAENFARPAAPDSRLFQLRRFHYDTAGAANPVTMNGLRTLVNPSQILFGTDHPFVDGPTTVRDLQNCGFSRGELQGIERDNALTLLPRLA